MNSRLKEHSVSQQVQFQVKACSKLHLLETTTVVLIFCYTTGLRIKMGFCANPQRVCIYTMTWIVINVSTRLQKCKHDVLCVLLGCCAPKDSPSERQTGYNQGNLLHTLLVIRRKPLSPLVLHSMLLKHFLMM